MSKFMKGVNMYNTSNGLNIGTGLMLESILDTLENRIDDTRTIPNRVKLSDYKYYLINIDSLIHNIISSYDREVVDQLIKGDNKLYKNLYNKCIDEAILIRELLRDINVIYYIIDYPRYKDYIKPINPETKGGKVSNLVSKIIASLEGSELDIVRSKHYLKDIKRSDRCLISTSNTLDLLNMSKVTLELLEFHTGVLKKSNMFYTKLKERLDLPFSEVILFSIGDKKGMIKPVFNSKERGQWLEDLIARDLKPFNIYSRDYIIGATKNKDLLAKLKTIPNLY